MVVVKITHFEAFQFTLPLRWPLRAKDHILHERTGLIIELGNSHGDVALGEISPLPGFSSEDLIQARDQLRRLRKAVMGSSFPDNLGTLSGGFDRWPGGNPQAPSVRFGFESAVLGLVAAARGKLLAECLSEKPLRTISINGLLSGSPEDIQSRATALVQKGYQAFKLKVGRHTVTQDIAIVRQVRNIIGDGKVLRLDANRAWEIDMAVAFAEGLDDIQIDYIEEPVKSLALLRRLASEPRMSLPLAMDESLVELTPTDLRALTRIRAVVLKPTLLGLENTFVFARCARSLGMTPVISASFESGVGLGILAHMAAAIHNKDVAAGLDTLDWFARDLRMRSFAVNQGRLQVSGLPHCAEELDKHCLQPI